MLRGPSRTRPPLPVAAGLLVFRGARAAHGPVICRDGVGVNHTPVVRRAGLALTTRPWSRLPGIVPACRDAIPAGGHIFHHLD